MSSTRFLMIISASLVLLGGPAQLIASTPKGSLTIDRISKIKYPTHQAWSPDGKAIAFLWDAAGKQDIYTVEPAIWTSYPAPCSSSREPPTSTDPSGRHSRWSTRSKSCTSRST